MYSLEEYVSEYKGNAHFEYVLLDNSYFEKTEHKIMQNQKDSIFLPCIKMVRNGKISFYYVVNKEVPLSTIDQNKSMSLNSVAMILKNLIKAIIFVKNNDFLSWKNLVLSPDKIYFDSNFYSVKLVYLPIGNRNEISDEDFELVIKQSVMNLINHFDWNNNYELFQLMKHLENPAFMLDDVKHIEKKEIARPIGETHHYKLVARNIPGQFEIEIDRDQISIGSMRGFADVVIPYGRGISKKHVTIERIRDALFVKDENSTNGTFINGDRLSGVRRQVLVGDIIKLAVYEFVLK